MATDIGAEITYRYLHHLVHPALLHLPQALCLQHSELELHLSLLEGLYTMISCLRADFSDFGGKNRVTTINLIIVVQEL